MSAASREQAKKYLATHMIPQMFESLLASLMMERPEDPVSFIEAKMKHLQGIGLENVNWETFVYNLHPYRDSLRNKLIRDGSKYDTETNQEKCDQSVEDYQPELFKLTEPVSNT